jgi:hypothetical protein
VDREPRTLAHLHAALDQVAAQHERAGADHSAAVQAAVEAARQLAAQLHTEREADSE